MFYKKSLKGKNQSLIKLNFSTFSKGVNVDDDASVINFNNSVLSYNFFYKDGALTQGYGFKELTLPNGYSTEMLPLIYYYEDVDISNLWLFRCYNATYSEIQNKIVGYSPTNGNLYWVKLNKSDTGVHWLVMTYEGMFTQCPNMVNYRYNDKDVLIISSPADGMFIWDTFTDPGLVENAPKITSMCIHYERLFATVDGEKNAVWFSQEFDPTQWDISGTGAGFIQMVDERGALNKVISYLDYVYIFRDYGIARLAAYAEESQFDVTQLFVSSSKIYADTVTVCGDIVMMLTGNGLYAFDGINSKKIDLKIDKLFEDVDNSKAVSCYFNGKYYLGCKLNFNDGETVLEENGSTNNALVVFDVEDGSLSITRGVDISAIPALQSETISKVVCCVRGEHSTRFVEIDTSGEYFNGNMPKMWQSPESDLNYPNKLKLIKDLYIETEQACSIKVVTDGVSKGFNLTAGKNRLRINKKAKTLSIKIQADTATARTTPPKVFVGLV